MPPRKIRRLVRLEDVGTCIGRRVDIIAVVNDVGLPKITQGIDLVLGSPTSLTTTMMSTRRPIHVPTSSNLTNLLILLGGIGSLTLSPALMMLDSPRSLRALIWFVP
ncbi:hypothetical protein P8452_76491 [Trifolium repens]|nr:hypothetical protein QL285_094334 [Trifolium repens]WJX95138.1 hypothetical protein P8452_76491 [Trifolium repens]